MLASSLLFHEHDERIDPVAHVSEHGIVLEIGWKAGHSYQERLVLPVLAVFPDAYCLYGDSASSRYGHLDLVLHLQRLQDEGVQRVYGFP